MITPAFAIITMTALTGAFALAAGLIASVIHQVAETREERARQTAKNNSRKVLDTPALAR